MAMNKNTVLAWATTIMIIGGAGVGGAGVGGSGVGGAGDGGSKEVH